MVLRRNNSPAYYQWQIPFLLKCQLRFGFDDFISFQSSPHALKRTQRNPHLLCHYIQT
jgi:hypothetical protein